MNTCYPESMKHRDCIYEAYMGNFQTPALTQRCEGRLVLLHESSLSANMSTHSAGVCFTAQGKNIHAFPNDLLVLLQARWFQFEAYAR